MFIEDFSTRAYFAHGGNVRAVGWLEAGHPFPRGPVAPEFLAVLKGHVAKACQPVIFMGDHECSLCAEEGRYRTGHHNLLIPTAGLLYVAPELVVHYIEDHGYQPPAEFVAAVLACPEQESAAYFDLLRPFEPTLDGDVPEGTCCFIKELPPSGSQEWGKIRVVGGLMIDCSTIDEGGEGTESLEAGPPPEGEEVKPKRWRLLPTSQEFLVLFAGMTAGRFLANGGGWNTEASPNGVRMHLFGQPVGDWAGLPELARLAGLVSFMLIGGALALGCFRWTMPWAERKFGV